MSETAHRRPVPSSALWFGTLAPPAAWGVQLLTGDQLVELACAPGSGAPAVEGVGVETILLAITVASTLIVLLAGYVSYRSLQKTAAADPSTGGRARWMSMAGIFVSGMFLIIIVQGYLPMFFLSGCEPAL